MKCRLCGTDIEVPLCCSTTMTQKSGKFICDMCGTESEVPICCEVCESGKGKKSTGKIQPAKRSK